MTFGRPGYGAPVRTRSGRVRTAIRGNTEIRFQENPSVQKTIYNAIRYQSNPEFKAQYQRDLGEKGKMRERCGEMEKGVTINMLKGEKGDKNLTMWQNGKGVTTNLL